jgi:hypothetical protein
VLEAMLEGTRARRRAGGIPGDAQTHWLEEVRRLEQMVGRPSYLGRFQRWISGATTP